MGLTPLLAAIISGRALPMREAVDDGFWEAARQDGVHALVAETIGSAGWPADAAPCRTARDELAAAAAGHALRELDLRRVLECLDAHEVHPVLIKGAALACTHYARPYLRPCLDTDLLITEPEVSSARAAFESLAATLIPHVTGRIVMPQFHYRTRDASGGAQTYDVHWRIAVPPRFAATIPPEELSASAAPIPALGPYARGPSAVHALLLACVHREAHHAAGGPLIWLYDVHLLCERLAPAEEDRVCELASDRGIRAAVARTLADAGAAFGGERTGRLAGRLAPPGRRPSAAARPGRVRAAIQDLSALRWRERAELLRELLTPGAGYMRTTYAPGSRAPLPLLYLRRIVRGALRRVRR